MTEATTATSEAPVEEPGGGHSAFRRLAEWVAVIVVALVAAFLIKSFVVEPYSIPTGSMEPTIEPGDRVLVDKLTYHVSDGSIMVFKRPALAVEGGPYKDLIKRVVGTPGQTLRSGPFGEIFVDGKLLDQPWLSPESKVQPGPNICAPGVGYSHQDCVGRVLHLPAGEYYMMGDNRVSSYDSRYWGPISGNLFIGKAFVRIWPLSRLHWF